MVATVKPRLITLLNGAGRVAVFPLPPLMPGRNTLKFGYHAFQFVGEALWDLFAESIHQRAVIPKCAVLSAFELSICRIALETNVAEDATGVMQLVAGGHEADRGAGVENVVNVRLLPFAPRWLGLLIGVRASLDDGGDMIAEAAADFFQGRLATLILDGVVKQSGDGLVFGRAVFHRKARYA